MVQVRPGRTMGDRWSSRSWLMPTTKFMGGRGGPAVTVNGRRRAARASGRMLLNAPRTRTRAARACGGQYPGVPAQVVFHKRGNKEIGMVVSLLPPQRQWDTRFGAGGLQQPRLELRLQEPVRRALVHQKLR